jgi:hypothetical protein
MGDVIRRQCRKRKAVDRGNRRRDSAFPQARPPYSAKESQCSSSSRTFGRQHNTMVKCEYLLRWRRRERERERESDREQKMKQTAGGLVRGNGDGPRTVSDRSDLAAREKLSSSARCVICPVLSSRVPFLPRSSLTRVA